MEINNEVRLPLGIINILFYVLFTNIELVTYFVFILVITTNDKLDYSELKIKSRTKIV